MRLAGEEGPNLPAHQEYQVKGMNTDKGLIVYGCEEGPIDRRLTLAYTTASNGIVQEVGYT